MPRRQKWRGLGSVSKLVLIAANRRLFWARRVKRRAALLLAIDHHRGSEENQPGEEYFDPDLDDGEGGVSSLLHFRANMRAAGLEDTVDTALSPSQVVARLPMAAPALVFIDGGHSMPAALADWQNWGARVMAGGFSPFMMSSPIPPMAGAHRMRFTNWPCIVACLKRKKW